MSAEYEGRQYVGIDLHRWRSVIFRCQSAVDVAQQLGLVAGRVDVAGEFQRAHRRRRRTGG